MSILFSNCTKIFPRTHHSYVMQKIKSKKIKELKSFAKQAMYELHEERISLEINCTYGHTGLSYFDLVNVSTWF